MHASVVGIPRPYTYTWFIRTSSIDLAILLAGKWLSVCLSMYVCVYELCIPIATYKYIHT